MARARRSRTAAAAGAARKRACFSVGYQGKSLDDVCALLRRARVTQVLDVREGAWSHKAEFRKPALSTGLHARGFEYVHLPSAGNPFRAKQGRALDVRWRAKYRAHVEERPDVVEAVWKALKRRRTAVLCFEADARECHRSVLLEVVQAQVSGLTITPLA